MPYADPAMNHRSKLEYNRSRRAAWFAGKVCAVCGSPDRLEADHVDPAKKSFQITWSLSDERLAPELAKCQPLCYGCHKKKTALEAAAKAAARTVCSNGHALTESNVYMHLGSRLCRTCVRAWQERDRRNRGVKPARRDVTHCIHGHEYTQQNTYITKSGRYRCKACRAADMRRRNAAGRAA